MTAVLWLLLLVVVVPHVWAYWTEQDRGRQDDEAVQSAYFVALQAAQRIHSLAWSARQAMYEEARRSIGGE